MATRFQAIYRCGYVFKAIAIYKGLTIKTGCLKITRDGISSKDMDKYKRILVDFEIHAKGFDSYVLNDDMININISYDSIAKLLKSIKKSDKIELIIYEQTPNNLIIKIIPRDNHRTSEAHEPINYIPSPPDIDLPTGYKSYLMIQTNEYQQFCKETKNIISSTSPVRVQSYLHDNKFIELVFSCGSDVTGPRFNRFSNQDINNCKCKELVYDEDFSPSMLTSLIKLLGIGDQMYFYYKTDLPLKVHMNIGGTGYICVYIKPDSLVFDSNSEDDD